MIGAVIIVGGLALLDVFLVLGCAKLEREHEEEWERYCRSKRGNDHEET